MGYKGMGSDSEQASFREFLKQGAEAAGRDVQASRNFGENKNTGPGRF